MTREDAISIMNVIVHMLEPQYDTDRIEDAVEIAIKALEQEPCEDVISREYLFKVLDDFCGHDRTAAITLDTLADLVYDIPSVKPQEPILDKIRAEIEELIEWHDCPIEYDNGNDAWYCEACNQAIKIIDKYRGES